MILRHAERTSRLASLPIRTAEWIAGQGTDAFPRNELLIHLILATRPRLRLILHSSHFMVMGIVINRTVTLAEWWSYVGTPDRLDSAREARLFDQVSCVVS